MSPYLKNLLKTKLSFRLNRIYVFTTSITLNERFTRKQPRHVFIINNGFTGSFKNNYVKGRIVFPNRNTGKNGMFTSFNEGNVQKNIKSKPKVCKLARRRRSVLMPPKLKNNVEYIHDKSPLNLQSRYYFSSCNPIQNTGRYKFVPKGFYRPFYKRPKRAAIFPSWCLPGKYQYTQQLPYKWKRKQVSKAQLDDEIDRYMAEVKIKPIHIAKEEDAMSTSTTEQYLRETEKYLKETEESD